MLTLRPHHALCLQKFTGHGYDEAFTGHMTALVRILARTPEMPVLLTEGCDVLCACCPHNRNGCVSLQKVSGMDNSVLALCSLSYGEILSWDQLSALARAHILSTGSFSSVCTGCQWFTLCSATKVGLLYEFKNKHETEASHP